MTRINLPPGAYGLSLGSFKTKRVKPGTSVNVDDPKILKLIKNCSNTELGILSDKELVGIKTKNGRWCQECRRLWQTWSKTCPKCSRETVPEADMPG
jgi:hypothetical protein